MTVQVRVDSFANMKKCKSVVLFNLLCILFSFTFVKASPQNVIEMSNASPGSNRFGNVDITRGFGFASYFSDHMVLQRAPHRVRIWGYSPWFGNRVEVTVGNFQTHQAEVGEETWSVTLDPVSHPGPYQISAKSTFETIVLNDVLFGDVWLCSGQSNMEFTVAQCYNASKEIQDANNYPLIRLFTVALVASSKPKEDFDKRDILQPWSVASNKTVGRSYGRNVFSAVCWFFGKRMFQKFGVPIGLIDSDYTSTTVEVWSSPDALAKCGIHPKLGKDFVKRSDRDDVTWYPTTPSALWNSMIYPLLKMTIYGAIWYQGEANAPMPHTYNCTFPAMIADWRSKWFTTSKGQTDPLFPFGFVTLGPRENNNEHLEGYPEMRWHQTADFGYVPNSLMPNTFTAQGFDLPDFPSLVHIRDKQDVTARLALGGLAVAYRQENITFQGPFPQTFKVNRKFQEIEVMYGSQQLMMQNTVGFEICCALGSNKLCDNITSWWLQAPIISASQSSVLISTKTCASDRVSGIRYAWRVSPCSFKDCALYSTKNFLPATPFQFTSLNFTRDGTYKIDLTKPHRLYGQS